MASGGFFKDVLIEDVLEWQKNIFELNPLHLNKLTVEGNNKFPFYGQSVMNNGIISYECLQDRVLNNKNSKPTILIHSNNQNLVYLETPFYLKDGHGATSVLQANCLTKNSALYLISIISKVIKEKFNYDFKATKIALKNTKIFVPYINQEPAFSYMDDFITELQAERLQELQGYLQVTGLSNYTLTDEELHLIDRFDSIEWMSFDITNVFNVNNTHSILSSWITPNSGGIPYVTAGESNNSISTYIDYDISQIEKGNSIMIGGKTLVITYQESDYFSNDSHNLALYAKDEQGKLKDNQFFMISSLYKSLKPRYSWGDSISKKKIQLDTFDLPVKNGLIDYEFMSKWIQIIKKLVIADVVKYADRELSAYQSVIA